MMRKKNYSLIRKMRMLEKSKPVDNNIYTYHEFRDEDGKISVAHIGVKNDSLDDIEVSFIVY